MRALRAHAGELAGAALFFVAAATVTARSVWHAVDLEPASEFTSMPHVLSRNLSDRRRAPRSDILAAVAVDPFQPERSRPSSRFRLQDEVDVGAVAAVVLAESTTARLLGTVLGGAGGSFAMCQLGAEAPRVVRVGQSIGQLTLRHVEQGKATLENEKGERIELTVPKAGNPP